ncbi:MAG: non-canonical purine NTP pyrophosphatase [Candidatus Micrarchaeaceae archaeon]|jgi:non-canonical purine NTP pyrophosphatase (RdgB/HAM1 family)
MGALELLRSEQSQLCFVTSNHSKAVSANTTLMAFGFPVAQLNRKIEEPYHTNSPVAIATEKIRRAAKLHDIQIICFDGRQIEVERLSELPIICEDGGFFVNALNGRPGVQINPYLEEKGVEGLLEEMRGRSDRSAHFWEVLAYKDPLMEKPEYFESIVHGVVADEKRGKMQDFNWSKLHLVFVANGYTKTWAEMNAREYKDYDLRERSRWNRLGEFLRRRSELVKLKSVM